MKAILIYDYFYSMTTDSPTIGGIQTYIQDLSLLLKRMGHEVCVFQKSENVCDTIWNDIMICSLVKRSEQQKTFERAIKRRLKTEDSNNTLIIFMTHTMNFKLKHFVSVSIQHGIYWDLPSAKRNFNPFIQLLIRLKHAFYTLRKMNSVPYCVFVDYNFLNWLRTQQYLVNLKYSVIPNYANYLEEAPKRSERIRILFARRLEEYRGTRIFSQAIRILLNKGYQFEVTIAGNGPDKNFLLDYFKNDTCVSFLEYKHGEQEKVMSTADISVVCSLGSEGTSLSLLESMGCGCAVVCTNVGGMTNIVLDGYNGLICDITAESLAGKIESLLLDRVKMNELSKNAINTVRSSFTKDRWEADWASFLSRVLNKEM